MKIVACLLALVVGFVVAIPSPAQAGSSTDAALALGSFAVLNQLLRGETVLHDLFGHSRATHQTVVVQPAPRVIYAPPPATVIYTPVHGHHHHFVPPGHAKKHHYHHHGHGHGHHRHDKHGWR